HGGGAPPRPSARLARPPGRQVRLAAGLLCPGRPAPWPALLDRARDLDERLRRMGGERGARLVEPAAAWYGLDPIHFRRRARREVWAHVLPAPAGPEAETGRRLPLLGAAEMRLWGRDVGRPPALLRRR